MINWIETQLQLGRTSIDGKRPVVVCNCDICNKQHKITIRVKSKVVNNQMPWVCPSCVLKRPEQHERITKQANMRWQNDDYRMARSKSSKSLWQNHNFRVMHSEAVKEAMSSVDVSSMLKARYSNNAAKELLRQKSLALFADTEFKTKHKARMSNADVRKRISDGMHKVWLNAEYRENALRNRLKQVGRTSKLQLMLYDILDDLNVTYFKEGEDTAIGFYVFDCLIPRTDGQQLLIECQGDYWHSLDKTAKQDRSKFTYINKYFPSYKIIYIWEREFYQHNKVRNRLENLLGINKQIVDFNFNKVVVKQVDAVKDFLDIYHYIGPGRGGKRFGAYIDDKLIAVSVFSSPGRQNIANKFNAKLDDIIECSRFCIHPSYQKRNFASWFLSRCSKQFNNKLLISYADTTAGHTGTMYKAAGWELHHEVPADYWYSDIDGFVMHKKTLYNRAVNLQITEKEFAAKYGFIKIFGGKKLCFTKQV